MKTLNYLLTTVLLFFASNNAYAQVGIEKKEINTDEHYTNVVDSYLRGLNEKDLEGVLFLYADNATIEDPVGSKVIEGIKSITKFYSGEVGS